MSTEPQAPTPQDVPSRLERRAQAAADALRTLVRDLYHERFGYLPEGELDFPLRLDLACRTRAEAWQLDFSPPLPEQIHRQLEDVDSRLDVFDFGYVYDYHRQTSHGADSRPPSPLSVFAGYDMKGIPQWHDLIQAFLLERDGRADQLYEQAPRILALVQYGKTLNRDQLACFGKTSRTYAVLAQVVAGFFQLPAGPDTSADRRFSLTCQIVESRDARRRFRLHLNVLSHVPWTVLEEHFAAGRLEHIQRAVRLAQRQVARLEGLVLEARDSGLRDQASALMRQVPSILRELGISLEHGHRQDTRRTEHARRRRQEQRPTQKALSDAQAFQDDGLLFDEKKNSWIVVADGRRAHAFGTDGRHITSFPINQESVAFRLRTARWRATDEPERDQFRRLMSGGAG